MVDHLIWSPAQASRGESKFSGVHDEDTSIQIYRKFHLQKLKIFR